MLPSQLIAEAYNDIFCRLAPSSIHGVGVFAIKSIPKDTIVFRTTSDWVKVDKKFLTRINPEVASLYRDMLVDDELEDDIEIPSTGFSSIDISFYLNHSNNPNCRYDIDNDFIIAKQDIDVGEELTYNYKVFGSPNSYAF